MQVFQKHSRLRSSWSGRVVYPPAALKAFQAERGQAALPNHELFSFESLSVSLCLCASAADFFAPSANLELSLLASVLATDCWPIARKTELE